MSRWVRGIYNSAANFVLSGSLRAASGRILDRDTKHLHKESIEPNQCDKSCEPGQSCGCTTASSTCAGTCTCTTAGTSACGRSTSTRASNKDRDLPNNHGDSCTCALCRDYTDYLNRDHYDFAASIRTEGQGAGARIRVSNEPRTFKQTNNGSTSDVEHITGIPTGVTV